MFPIAGQTAGPIGLTFFCGNSWVVGGCSKKNRKQNFFENFFNIFFQHFFLRATPGPSASLLSREYIEEK